MSIDFFTRSRTLPHLCPDPDRKHLLRQLGRALGQIPGHCRFQRRNPRQKRWGHMHLCSLDGMIEILLELAATPPIPRSGQIFQNA